MSVLRVLAAFIVLAACEPHDPLERRFDEACGRTFDFSEMRARAVGGSTDAIECMIARADAIFLDQPERRTADSVVWRYLLWIVSGEEPEDLFALAAEADRDVLTFKLSIVYFAHIRATGEWGDVADDPDSPEYVRDDGCVRRPPKMDRIWRAAIPGDEYAHCADAVLDHPRH